MWLVLRVEGDLRMNYKFKDGRNTVVEVVVVVG